MGAFADTFGIRPWEWDLMEAREVLHLKAYIDEQQKSGGDDGNV